MNTFDFSDPALKLLIGEILQAEVVGAVDGNRLKSHGISYTRVHAQGTLKGSRETGFWLQDSTGSIALDLHPLDQGAFSSEKLEDGTPAIVIGKVYAKEDEDPAGGTPTTLRCIQARRLFLFEKDSKIPQQWIDQTEDLAHNVYPLLAADQINDKLATASLEDSSAKSTRYCSPLCHDGHAAPSDSSLFWLTLNHWDCVGDCKYRCMWLLENRKHAQHGKAAVVEKYFGKWPFVRMLGAQEPASVIFSLTNLFANLYCILDILKPYRHVRSRSHRSSTSSTGVGATVSPSSKLSSMARIYTVMWLVHFILSCNAWLWSSVFHCRDTRTTERFDYFSAGALVTFNLFLSLCRVAGLTSVRAFTAVGAPLLGLFLVHVHRMSTILFDYGFHVALCVCAGALQTAAWLGWALGSQAGRTHPGRRALLSFIASVNVAMLLEVLDFPPLWKVFDAHALWHAATAPLTLLWYRFVKADIAQMTSVKPSFPPISSKTDNITTEITTVPMKSSHKKT